MASLRNNWPMSDERILDMDPVLLQLADLFIGLCDVAFNSGVQCQVLG